MGFLKRFAQGELGLGRIEAFSDAVFAIVVMLLALELTVPILHKKSARSYFGKMATWRTTGLRLR
jgi:uncharacterized membrane protein